MPERVSLSCTCGSLRGHLEVKASAGNRVICYCDDCQAYAHFLERPDLLDQHGGSDIYQTRPAMVRLESGIDQLACVRLSPNGLMRWYAKCCRTPVGNTLPSARGPFVGLSHAFIAPDTNGRSRDELLGNTVGRVYGKFAIGGLPEGAADKISAGTMFRTVTFLLRCVLARGYRPSPFFDLRSNLPLVEPHVLTPEVRDQLRRRVGSPASR